jgi:hypothetical protein
VRVRVWTASHAQLASRNDVTRYLSVYLHLFCFPGVQVLQRHVQVMLDGLVPLRLRGCPIHPHPRHAPHAPHASHPCARHFDGPVCDLPPLQTRGSSAIYMKRFRAQRVRGRRHNIQKNAWRTTRDALKGNTQVQRCIGWYFQSLLAFSWVLYRSVYIPPIPGMPPKSKLCDPVNGSTDAMETTHQANLPKAQGNIST